VESGDGGEVRQWGVFVGCGLRVGNSKVRYEKVVRNCCWASFSDWISGFVDRLYIGLYTKEYVAIGKCIFVDLNVKVQELQIVAS
jgi:hypothetical protein